MLCFIHHRHPVDSSVDTFHRRSWRSGQVKTYCPSRYRNHGLFTLHPTLVQIHCLYVYKQCKDKHDSKVKEEERDEIKSYAMGQQTFHKKKTRVQNSETGEAGRSNQTDEEWDFTISTRSKQICAYADDVLIRMTSERNWKKCKYRTRVRKLWIEKQKRISEQVKTHKEFQWQEKEDCNNVSS